MTAQQRAEFRDTYNQLRLAISWPGDEVGGIRRPFQPVNKDLWTWDMAMASEDTPDIAARRNVRLTSLWATIGMRRAVA